MANPDTTISLGVARPEDLYPLAALENKVYFPEKFDVVAFGPLRDHPSNIALRAQALAKADTKGRKSRIVKAVASEGKIVGLMQWSWNFVGDKDEEKLGGKEEDEKKDGIGGEGGGWGKGANVKFCEDVFGGADRHMARSCGGGDYAKLHTLVVHPEYQRMGIGSMLLQDGLKEADVRGLQCVLAASRQGEGLYRKYGFEVIRVMELRLEEYKGGEGLGAERHVVMHRPGKRSG